MGIAFKNLLFVLLGLMPTLGMAGTPVVREGLLDLSELNFKKGETALLQGDWEFFWQQILSPDEMPAAIGSKVFPIPSGWPRILHVCCGYATYRLRVEVGEARNLALDIPHMSTASRLFVNGQEIFAAGQVGTSPETSIPSRHSAQVMLPESKTLEFVLQISNFHHARGGTYGAMRIGNAEVLARSTRTSQLIEMGIIGGIVAIGIYHLALFFQRRETVTIAFSLCCFAVGLRLSTVGHRLFEVFVVDLSWATMFRLEYLSLYIAPPLIWFYVQQLFPTDIRRPYVIVTALAAAAYCISLFVLTPLVFTAVINWFFIFAVTVSLVMFLIVLKSVYQRRTAALTILIGSLTIIVASLIDMINMLVFNEYQMFVFHLGFLGFTICQSFAIAQIYNQFFRNLENEERMRRHSFNQLAKVFYPHQLNMMKAGRPLEETMPTGQSNACVLSFDIVGSSRIEHIHVKSFLETSIKRCLALIDEGYDPEQLTATGYRIKEIGDGFLCSVGFPFRAPGMGNLATASVELALRFVDIFHQEVQTFAYSDPIYCCIGIAYDAIEGYFPSTGTLEYDVYGRSVVLATRYEGMRRSIFPNGVTSSIIILQRKVWMSLGDELRLRFKAFDLDKAGIHVRDDYDAKVLYFIEIPAPAQRHLMAS